MTCIIGIKRDHTVYIGGDKIATDNDGFFHTIKDSKVFYKDSFLFGCSGSFRVTQILKYDFDIPSRDESLTDMEYLVSVFIPALQNKLEERKAVKNSDNGQEIADYFRMIFAYRKNLYSMYFDYQIQQSSDDILASGIGERIALASMKALNNLHPRKMIEKSLEIVQELNGSVRGPFTICDTDYNID